MARQRPKARIPELIASATRVFIESGGFQRTQIGDVARAMGVAKGTIYLYVESKEALFDLVLRCADDPPREPDTLPVPTPAPGSTVELAAGRIRAGGRFPALTEALSRTRTTEPRTELTRVLTEIYDVLAANRTAIKLIGTSAHDLPELAAVWYGEGRARLSARLAEYIGMRASAGQFAPVASARVAARLVVETLTWFAVHRHWDPMPEPMDEDESRSTAVDVLVRGLSGDAD